MLREQNRAHGFMMAEMIVAMSLLGLIFVGLAVSMHGFGTFNRFQWARQQCTAAAQAQLDSLVVMGKPLLAEDIERLWSKVTLSTDRSDGDGQWTGLELLEVTAETSAGPRQVTVRLARYVQPAESAKAEGGTL